MFQIQVVQANSN